MTWKRHEKRVAEMLGGERTSRPYANNPDVVVDNWLVIECKHRARLPEWLKDALRQAKVHAGADQLAMAVLHERNQRDSLVVMSLKDFKDWFCGEEWREDDEATETKD